MLKSLAHAVTGVIASLGYPGIVLMMAIESACIPLPSEIIMPFGGYLVFAHPGRFTLWGMAVAGALGCVAGSLAAYYAGLYGGRPWLEKHGRYFHIHHKDLDRSHRWFEKYGDQVIFF